MSKSLNREQIPKSVRHKRILDLAADNPDASMEALAEEVPTATPEHVERILEMYGDPAASQSDDPASEPEASPSSDGDQPPDPGDLTERQLDVLEAIHKHPEASQRDLAEILDVSGATISNRANSIDGFDWAARQEFTEAVFGSSASPAENNTMTMSSDDTEPRPTVGQLTERLTSIEQGLEAVTEESRSPEIFSDPELAHKVVHACMDAETITEDEELQILKAILE